MIQKSHRRDISLIEDHLILCYLDQEISLVAINFKLICCFKVLKILGKFHFLIFVKGGYYEKFIQLSPLLLIIPFSVFAGVGYKPQDVKQFESTGQCPGCDLSGDYYLMLRTHTKLS